MPPKAAWRKGWKEFEVSNQGNHGDNIRYEKITKTVTASRPRKPSEHIDYQNRGNGRKSVQSGAVNVGYGSEEIEYEVRGT